MTSKVTYGLTACTPGSAPGPKLSNEYSKTLLFPLLNRPTANAWDRLISTIIFTWRITFYHVFLFNSANKARHETVLTNALTSVWDRFLCWHHDRLNVIHRRSYVVAQADCLWQLTATWILLTVSVGGRMALLNSKIKADGACAADS